MSSTITITSGSDSTFTFSFKDQNDDPIPLLIGSDVIIFDVRSIGARFTGTITDAPGGVVEVDFECTDPVPKGCYKFRVQVTNEDGDSVATPPITLRII